MFKIKDNMRPGPTPERVLAICRLVENKPYSSEEIFRYCALDPSVPSGEEYIRRSIEAAEELGLIKKIDKDYTINVPYGFFESAESFRKAISPLIFSRKDSTFFKLTEWYIKNADKAMSINKFDEFAADAAKDGVVTVTENDILGWRFWMRFLGIVYQYNRTLIPNMKVRLQDVFSTFDTETRMTCIEFVSWLKQNLPETAMACTDNTLPLAVSNGLRTLESEGKIDIISTKDAIRVSLYHLRGVVINDFSDIVIKDMK